MRAKRNSVDPTEAVRLHRDEEWRVPKIAEHFGVHRPAIYKAFRQADYCTAKMITDSEQWVEPGLPPPPIPGQNPPSIFGARTLRELDIAARPRVNRDPCKRCGVRADVGCRHQQLPALGWFVG